MTYDPFLDPPRERRGCSSVLLVTLAVDLAMIVGTLAAVRAGRGIELVASAAVLAGTVVTVIFLRDRARRRHEADPVAVFDAAREALRPANALSIPPDLRRRIGEAQAAGGGPLQIAGTTFFVTDPPLGEREQLFNLADPGCELCGGMGRATRRSDHAVGPCPCTGLPFEAKDARGA